MPEVGTVFNFLPYNVGFVLSEAAGMRSRDNGVLTEGQNLQAGTVLQLVSGKLTAWAAGTNVAGILMYNSDATAADLPVSFIARDAEVNKKVLIYPTGTDAEVTTKLGGLDII